MPFEHVVALQITDEESYAKYREGMTPLLHAVGGGFRYDFRVSETLQAEGCEEINRVFAIYFPDESTSEAFFAKPEYLEVRKTYFESAVATVVRLGNYTRDE